MRHTSKIKRLDYIESIAEKFPNTIFQFSYRENNEIKWSKKRLFYDFDKFYFIKKDYFYRGNLWSKESDELRLDFDYQNLEENISRMREVIEKLLSLGIEKFETYITGGKGTHLTFRYNFEKFRDYDRKLIRKALFEQFNLDIEIDESLFQTVQVIGLEGFNHRKTNNPKQRIKVDYDSYKILEDNINFEYLENKFINHLNKEIVKGIIKLIENNFKHDEHSFEIIEKSRNYNSEQLKKHLIRFKEIYVSLEDGRKRILDCVTRYLYLTTRNIEETKYYLNQFCKSQNININIEQRVKSTLNSMKSNAIFIYHDVLTKKEFYKNWEVTSVV